jgi:hypothetical protein
LVTISDKKLGVDNNTDGIIDYYNADVITANDYAPGGMQMPGRTYIQASGKKYRYSINGQEKSDELNDNLTTALYWEYDSRILRRWNIDPVTKNDESPYLTFGGNPIVMIDPLGNDWYKNKKSGNIDWFDGSGKHKGYGKSLGVNFWSKTNSKGVKVWYGNSKDEEWQDKTLDAVVVKGTTSKHTLADDAFSWANYDRYESKIWTDQTITYKQLRNIGLSQKEISKNGFGLPIDRLGVFENYWQSEQDWRSMNYAVLDFATFFVPIPKVGMLRWLNKGVGYLGVGYTKVGVRVFGESFLQYNVRLTKIGIGGLGHGQFDAAHRATTFLKSDILEAGKWGARNWNTIYTNLEIGGKYFSIGINPWKREIYHMAPGFFK